MPRLDFGYVGRVGGNAVFGKFVAQADHGIAGERAFGWIELKVGSLQRGEDLVEVEDVVFHCFGRDEDVIQIRDDVFGGQPTKD